MCLTEAAGSITAIIFVDCLIALLTLTSTVMNKRDGRRHLCFVSDVKEKAFNLLHKVNVVDFLDFYPPKLRKFLLCFYLFIS